MSYAVVQHASGSGTGTSLTTGKALPGAPTAGNWIIAAVCLQQSTTTVQSFCPINTTDWFLVDDVLLGGSAGVGTPNYDNILRVIARKVQPGDTATMPAFCASGSSFNAWMAVEISGGSGTWTTDFHSARNTVDINGVAAITSPKDTALVNNCFALAFAAAYNETANGSWSAGWTVDENSHNGANYGAWGCAHQAISTAGTSFSATFTKAGTNINAKGIITILLTPSQPITPHIKRHRIWGGGNSAGTPGSVSMGGDPANGNLLVAYLNWADGSAAGPTVSGAWANYASALNGSNPIVMGLYRYASSDTRALPALCTAGSQVWSANVFEIGGVIGTFAADHASDKSGYQATGSTMTTTSDTTTATNQIVTTSFGNKSGASAVSAPTGADLMQTAGTNSQWGAWAAAENYDASSGTTVQTTWTCPSNINPAGYMQDIWGSGSSSTETGTGTLAFSGAGFSSTGKVAQEFGSGALAFSGIAFSAAGHTAHNETGSGTLAFSGLSFTASGVAKHTGTGTLAFSGIGIVAVGSGVTAPPNPKPKPVTLTKLRQVDPLTWNVPITDDSGRPTQDFQRKWARQAVTNAGVVPQSYIDGTVAANFAASKDYTVQYGSTILTAAQNYADTHLAPAGVFTVSTLPAAPTQGQMAKVTDATATTLGSIVAGGGSNKVPVWYDGANWIIG